MKKIVLLLILAMLFMAGCQPSEPEQTKDNNPFTSPDPLAGQTEPSSEATEPSSEATEPSSEATEPTVDPAKQAELDAFTALFGNYQSWYYTTTGYEYESPEDVKLRYFFCSGFEDESQRPTDEEWAELENQSSYFNINLDLFRLPVDKMDAVLTEYFGITLEDMSEESVDGLVYLESTDCYYFMAGAPTGLGEGFRAKDVETQSDGTLLLTYIVHEGTITEEIFEMGLKPNGEGYQILFNRRIDK